MCLPFSLKRLEEDRVNLAQKYELARRALDQEFGDAAIIGEDTGTGEVLKLIRQVGPTQTTVLIRGESGTGKELTARAIHQQSHRSDKPLVTLNCTTLTDSLLESELFGHKKGAFTGAIADKKGLFEAARRRHHLPRRDRRHHPQAAGRAAASSRLGRNPPGRRQRGDQGRRAPDRRHQQESRNRRPRGVVPRGPLLPAQRFHHHHAAAAQPSRFAAQPGPTLPGPGQQAGQQDHRRHRGAGGPGNAALPLAGEYPRAAEHHRTRRGSDPGPDHPPGKPAGGLRRAESGHRRRPARTRPVAISAGSGRSISARWRRACSSATSRRPAATSPRPPAGRGYPAAPSTGCSIAISCAAGISAPKPNSIPPMRQIGAQPHGRSVPPLAH